MRRFCGIAPRLFRFFARNLEAQPGPGIGPPAIRRAGRDAEHRRGLVQAQAGEGTQLQQLRLLRLDASETIQGIIQSQQTLVVVRRDEWYGVKVEAAEFAAALLTASPAGMFDEDAPHGLGGGGKEMTPILEL